MAFATYDTGRALGAAAAWSVGKVTGNQALSDFAGEGFSSAAGDLATSVGMALVPGLNAGMVRGAKKAADVVPDGAISVDDALGKAADFMKDGVPVRSVETKSGVQFIQEFTGNGDRITRRAGIDVNPGSAHVQQHGSHLNLKTQVNGRIQRSGDLKDPHTPIDSSTVRDGDY